MRSLSIEHLLWYFFLLSTCIKYWYSLMVITVPRQTKGKPYLIWARRRNSIGNSWRRELVSYGWCQKAPAGRMGKSFLNFDNHRLDTQHAEAKITVDWEWEEEGIKGLSELLFGGPGELPGIVNTTNSFIRSRWWLCRATIVLPNKVN